MMQLKQKKLSFERVLLVFKCLIVSIALLSCSKEERDDTHPIKKENRDSTKTSINQDSLSALRKENIQNFLKKPFDLYKFKSTKYSSLCGGIVKKDYLIQAPKGAIGYHFFMFEPRKANYVNLNGDSIWHCKLGYIGKNKRNIISFEDGLVINTYQPRDKYQGKYTNPNETLVEVTAKYNDLDLPEFAFVGLDTKDIIDNFGHPYYYHDSCMVYYEDSTVFILQANDRIIDWIKYARLSNKFDSLKNNKKLFQLD